MINTIGSDVTIKNSSLKRLKERVIENQAIFPWVNVLKVEAAKMPHQLLKELKLHIINDPRSASLSGELVDDMKVGDELDFQNRLLLIAPAVENDSYVDAVMYDRLFRIVFKDGTLERMIPQEIQWKPLDRVGEFREEEVE